jgi:serine/threonine protein kinase
MSIENSSTKGLNPLENFTLIKLLESSKYPVYKALDKRTNKEVALKLFPSTTGGCMCFEREKSFLSRLHHPTIITFFESADDCPITMEKFNSVSYISIEFAKHGDLLGPFMKGANMKENLARTFFQNIVSAISYMHSSGIAHMDLKLDNILIDDDFNPKVIDFDVSQSLTDKKQFGTGTVVYRAPEVKERNCQNFMAADIYSLGVILFVMVSGNPPYEEKQKERNGPWIYSRDYTLMRINNARYWEREAKARGGRNFYTKEFIDIVNWMLMEDPLQRPTMQELKSHEWFTGMILESSEYKEEMEKFMVMSGH